MYKVKGLQDYGCWCKKGEIHEVNNTLAMSTSRKGITEIIEFLGNCPYSKHHLLESIKSMKIQVKNLQEKIKRYEEMLK